jgi:hypothetical protein
MPKRTCTPIFKRKCAPLRSESKVARGIRIATDLCYRVRLARSISRNDRRDAGQRLELLDGTDEIGELPLETGEE